MHLVVGFNVVLAEERLAVAMTEKDKDGTRTGTPADRAWTSTTHRNDDPIGQIVEFGAFPS